MPTFKTNSGSSCVAVDRPFTTDTARTWMFGTPLMGSGSDYEAVGSAIRYTYPTTYNRWDIWLNPMPSMGDATVTFDTLRFPSLGMKTGTSGACYFIVAKKTAASGGNDGHMTIVYAVDVRSQLSTDSGRTGQSVSVAGNLTLVAGQSYYYGMAFYSTSNIPGLYRSMLGVDLGGYSWGDSVSRSSITSAAFTPAVGNTQLRIGGVNGDGVTYGSTTWQPDSATADGAGRLLLMDVSFTTTARTVCSKTTATTAAHAMPIPWRPVSSDPWWIVLQDVTCTNGGDITIGLDTGKGSASYAGWTLFKLGDADSTATGVKLDFGGTDLIAVTSSAAATTNVNLNGGTTEATDNIDILINVRPAATEAAGTFDVFWVNRKTGQGEMAATSDDRDICLMGHKTSNGLYRYVEGYAQNNFPCKLEVSTSAGTISIGSIKVCDAVGLIVGDSQCCSKGSAATVADRIGLAIQAAAGVPCIALGIAGNATLTQYPLGAGADNTSMLRRVFGTIGKGDIASMRGVEFFWAGAGINEITQNVAALGEAKTLARVEYSLGAIIALMKVNTSNRVGVIGLPPWHSTATETLPSGYTVATMNTFIRSVNSMMAEVCWQNAVPFYCPYKTVKASENTYLATDNIHYWLDAEQAGVVAGLSTEVAAALQKTAVSKYVDQGA